MCVLAGCVTHLSNLSHWQASRLSLLSPFLWTSSFYPWMFPAIRIDSCPHPRWILTKSVTEICKATLRELGESAPFISLKEDGKFLFYSCLSFPLLCFAGLSKRYSCLHWLKWTASRQTMKGISAVCYNHGQTHLVGLLSLFGLKLSQSMMNEFPWLCTPHFCGQQTEGLRLLW